MKKLIPLFCLLLCSIAMHAEVQTGSCGDNLVWQYDPDTKSLTILGSGDMTDYNWDNQPWYDVQKEILSVSLPNGLTSIGDYAFYNCTALGAIELPNTITAIGNSAFRYCSTLSSINIPNGVTTIEANAFTTCSRLTSIFIPNSVTSIGREAFSACGVTSIVVESGNAIYDSRDDCNAIIETITNTLVVGCLNSIIPNGIATIGDGAFAWCAIQNITLPNTVTTIGDEAFHGCFYLNEMIIPNGVTSIGDEAFNYCTSLTSLTIPETVVSIGNRVVGICPNITSLVVENGNTIYDSRKGCNAIIETASNTLISGCQKTIIPDGVLGIMDGAFMNCETLTSIAIPSSVTSIGGWAFSGCVGLTSIIIPDGVTSIENGTFSSCYNLSSVTLPNNITNIGGRAFDGCRDLNSITIPANVTNIGWEAFNTCSEIFMKGITPPSIEYSTFKQNATIYVPCSAETAYTNADVWTNMTIKGSTDYDVQIPTLKNGNIHILEYDCDNNTIVAEAVPMTSCQFSQWSDGNKENPRTFVVTSDTTLLEAQFMAQGQCGDNLYWSFDADTQTLTITGTGDMWDSNGSAGIWWSGLREQIHHVSLPNGLTRICSNAFIGTAIESITIPSTVTKLDNYIFGDNANLISISVQEGNPVYDSRNNCNAIIETATNRLCAGCRASDIPATVTTIGQGAFFGCIGLQTITLPESIRTLESQAFAYCSDLASINLNNGLTTITGLAFDYCHKLTSIIIPSSVTSIGERLTEGCDNLVQIIVEEGNPNYDSRNNCNALIETTTNTLLAGCQTTVIPEGITTIKSYAFFEQRNLTSITFPSTLQTIEDWAFPYCYSLGSVSIPSSVTYMGAQVFGYCWDIETITMEGAIPPMITSTTFNNTNAEIQLACGVAMSAYKASEYWADLDLKGDSGYKLNIIAAAEGTAIVVDADCADNSVTIEAVLYDVAYKFSHWSDGNTDNPRRIVMTQDTTMIPIFAEAPLRAVTIQGISVDIYNMSPYDYLYSGVQNVTFYIYDGSQIALFEQGSCGAWLGWSDGITENPYFLFIESDTTIISRFDVPTYSVNISAGEGGYLYDYTSSTQSNIIGERNICNNEIEVEAHPNDGYYFVGWTDGEQAALRSFALEQDTTITAIFAEIRPAKVTLGIDANSAGWGIVSGSGTYNLGDHVQISATPNEDYHFVEWSDGNGFATRDIYLTSDTMLYATFAPGSYGGKCGEHLYWNITNDTLLITGTGAMDIENYATWHNSTYDGYYTSFYFRGIVLPDGLTSIPAKAFYNYNMYNEYVMETVVIPASVEYIGHHAFASCYNLKKWQYLGNNLELGHPDGYWPNYILPDYSGIQFVQGPATLITECGGNYNTWNTLDTLIITNGYYADYDLPNLSYYDASKAADYSIGGYYRSDLLPYRTFFFPEDVVEIGDFALMNARYLGGATIPAGVTRIGESAFEECRSLDSVVFAGNNLETIGDWAFYNCHDLKKINLPEGVQEVGKAAFFNCTYLSELTIPSTMQRIADNGFGACAKMAKMYVNALVPPAIEEKTFEDVDRSIPVFVPKGTLERYQGDRYWSEFFNITEYDAPTGIFNASAQGDDNARKVLRNGQVLIIRGDQTYTVLGDKL